MKTNSFFNVQSIQEFWDWLSEKNIKSGIKRSWQRVAASDGVEVGWAAGESVLDTDFTELKQVWPDHMLFDFWQLTNKLPGDLLTAYYVAELKALSKDNPSGYPSSKQKRQAKEAARERLEDQAKDGRFIKRKVIPVAWDAARGEVLFGSTSATAQQRFVKLFQDTFGGTLTSVTAGELAKRVNTVTGDEMLSRFVSDVTPDEAAWAVDGLPDFLGNEFLLWLWYTLDQIDDTITLSDKSDVTVMLARILNLDCPRGVTGHDAFRTEGPTRLPEAKRAAQSGKLPRRAGVTMVRHEKQYEFALYAESFAVGALKIPPPPEDVADARARLEERVTQLREFLEGLDLLFARFLDVRLTKAWGKESDGIRRWLGAAAKAKAA
jgi:hypothetical protein